MDPDTPTLLISAGKGGVGKTVCSVLVTYWLARAGSRVGLLDCDLKDPNLPQVLQLDGIVDTYRKQYVTPDGVPIPYPYSTTDVSFPVFSSAFVFGSQRGILTRGETVRKIVTEFLHEVTWPKLDILVCDMDPSTSDALRTIRLAMNKVGAVVITEDCASAYSDAGRQIDALSSPDLRKDGRATGEPIAILGVLGNRVGYTGFSNIAQEERNIQSHTAQWQVNYLGGLRFDPQFRLDPMKAIATAGAPLGLKLAGVVQQWAGK